MMVPFSYILPIKASSPAASSEFTEYLHSIADQAELIIVDGSADEVFSEHHRSWGRFSLHLPPEPRLASPMGKVGGVMTGVHVASHRRVVIADDDVRYGAELQRLAAQLDDAAVVRPQNFFSPLTWHAVWDSGRSLINRATGGDWPGTLAIDRDRLLAAGGYSGEALFENLELARTLRAQGCQEIVANDCFVRRLPPTTNQFISQRTRQAYDEFARPARLVGWASVLPAIAALWLVGGRRRAWNGMALGVGLVWVLAESGRRKQGARNYFPFRCTLMAPLWAAERSVCVWAAMWQRVRGGVPYRGTRLKLAAHSTMQLRRQRTSSH